MPRQPRLDIPHVLHHVIVRGIERRDIFADDTDKERFVARLSTLLTKSGTKCFAWSLLSNHFHLLLMPTTGSLATIMRRLLTGYAVYFNRKYQRAGHLFQNRYKSILCEEEPYLLELIRYIHLNPLRAGLVPDLKALDRYRWSGHAVLLGHWNLEGQVTDEVLARFGKGQKRAQRNYQQFIADGVTAGRRDDLSGGGLKRSQLGHEESTEPIMYDERILGSGEFVAALTQEANISEGQRPQFSLTELLNRVCVVTGVESGRLQRPGRQRAVARARAIFCCLAVQEFGYTGKDVGTASGLGSAGVCIAVQRGENLLQNEPALREKIIGA